MVAADIVTFWKVLTEVLPFGSARDNIIISHILTGTRPPLPQNNQWLQDQTWLMITECWSEILGVRWGIHAIHQHLSALGINETAGEENQPVSQTATHVEDPIPFPGIQVVAQNLTPWRIHLPRWFLRLRPRNRIFCIFLFLATVIIALYFSAGIIPLFIVLVLVLFFIGPLFFILRTEGARRLLFGID